MNRSPQTIRSVKDEILSFYEKEVRVHVNLGRNKHADFTGTLSGVYPALFTVLPHDKNYRGKTAWSYAEILCGNVRVRASEPPARRGRA